MSSFASAKSRFKAEFSSSSASSLRTSLAAMPPYFERQRWSVLTETPLSALVRQQPKLAK